MRLPRWFVLVAALVLVGLLAPLPGRGRIWRAVQDLAHVPIGAVLAWLAIGWLRSRTQLSRVSVLITAFLLTAGFLAGIELVQPYVGRGRSVTDLATGVLGAASAVVVVEAATRVGLWRTVLLALSSLLLLLGALPATTTLLDVLRQRREMPLLGSFESEGELARWSWHAADVRRVGEHATLGDYALRIDLHPGRYPGVALESPPPDWRGYDTLAIDLHVEQAVTLILKVTDAAHDGRYEDRFHRSLELAPGAHAVAVSLTDIAAGPEGRALDLSNVAGVQLFAHDLAVPVTLHLDALRLVSAGP